MAWIELHTGTKRHRKLIASSRDLRCKRAHLLGHLGSLWLEVIDLAEDGDLSSFSDEVIAEYAGYSADPHEFVRLLLAHAWLDGDVGGSGHVRSLLVHDWLDYAGRYLTRKYSSSPKGRAKLAEIWEKHGRVYGDDSKRKKKGCDPPSDPNQVTGVSQTGHHHLGNGDGEFKEGFPSEGENAQPMRKIREEDFAKSPEWLAQQWCYYSTIGPNHREKDPYAMAVQFTELCRHVPFDAIQADLERKDRDRNEFFWQLRERLTPAKENSRPNQSQSAKRGTASPLTETPHGFAATTTDF